MKIFKVEFTYLDKAFIPVASQDENEAKEAVLEMLKNYQQVEITGVSLMDIDVPDEPAETPPDLSIN